MTLTKTSAFDASGYVSPIWHGMISWLLACLCASFLVGVGILAMGLIQNSANMFGHSSDPLRLIVQAGTTWIMASISGMFLISAPSLIMVLGIKALGWRRGISDALAGALAGGFIPGLLFLFAGNNDLSLLLMALGFGGTGGICGLVYWLLTRFFYRRGERIWQQAVISQF